MSDPVETYASRVVSGEEMAGPLVRLASERHLRDLEHGAERGLVWDWPAAERVVTYFRSVLRLSGGEHEGKPFVLEPSQVFIVGSIFGWKAEDGYRRFRVGFVEIGKGNGKSPLAAGIGLYMMTSDGEPRAEVYAAAVDKDQARVLFRDAVAMVDQSPALDSRITRSGGPGKEWNLAFLETGSFFRPVSSESRGRGKSGPRPHCALLDEIHEHPTPAMVEFMRAGTKGRRQALILMITNSGVFDPTSVCWQHHQYAERLLNGEYQDDSYFAFVCGLDEGDSWQDPAVWKKANPLLGVSIPEKYLTEQVREATGMPSKQSIVRRLNFCTWMESASPFVDPDVWRANGEEPDPDALEGVPCYGGLDLSGKNDLTALVLIFDVGEASRPVLSFFWTPEATLRQRQEKDRAPYDQWVGDGYLETTPGKTIHYGWVARKLGELASRYQIEAVAFDRWRSDDLIRELDDAGVDLDVVPHGQGFRGMSPSIESLEDDLIEHRLMHGNHPVLSWCASNTRIVEDPAGLRKFDKRKSTGRIDGMTALAMAAGLMARDDTMRTIPSYQMIFI